MATTAQDIANEYPIPVYRFVVSFGEESIPFSEVSGLDIGVETITYKDGLSKKHMPGQKTDVNITLKRGLVRSKSQFYDWISSISLNLVDKKYVYRQWLTASWLSFCCGDFHSGYSESNRHAI